MVKEPPSINTKPGPVICSLAEATSKPPISGLLYSQPVVREASFLQEAIIASKAPARKTALKILNLII